MAKASPSRRRRGELSRCSLLAPGARAPCPASLPRSLGTRVASSSLMVPVTAISHVEHTPATGPPPARTGRDPTWTRFRRRRRSEREPVRAPSRIMRSSASIPRVHCYASAPPQVPASCPRGSAVPAGAPPPGSTHMTSQTIAITRPLDSTTLASSTTRAAWAWSRAWTTSPTHEVVARALDGAGESRAPRRLRRRPAAPATARGS